jgi:DNA repair protein RadC
MQTPDAVADAWNKGPAQSTWFDETKECIVVFLLNTKLKCTAFHLVALGSINECTARIAEILRPCVVANCHSFIISHNHPSGDPLPSQADIDLTRRLNDAARIMGLRLQDHVIMGKPRHSGDRGFYSFREGGLI